MLSVFSLLTQSRTKRAQAAQELRDREEVEKELSVVKTWIQETRELLLNPTPDIDALLQELEVNRTPFLHRSQNTLYYFSGNMSSSFV